MIFTLRIIKNISIKPDPAVLMRITCCQIKSRVKSCGFIVKLELRSASLGIAAYA